MKTLLKLVCIFTCIALFTGCALLRNESSSIIAEDDDTPSITTGEPQPALYGLWLKEEGTNRDLWSIGSASAYLVETTGENSVRESFYKISAVDWVNGVITMSLKWVRVDGRYGGFDSPLHYLKVSIDGDAMYTSIGDEGLGIPADATNGPWIRQ